MTPSRFRSHVAVVALLAIATTMLLPATRAGVGASLSGRVFHADGMTPRSGVTVSLVDDGGNRTAQSHPTNGDGTFLIADASVGTYNLVVEAPEGAFVAPQPVALHSGANRPLALSVQAAQPNYQQQPGLGGGSSARGLPTWAKWVIAGGIAVVALVVIAEVNDEETPSSPF
jgi:hypothetical protein